jgi:hypothetical protein
MPVRALGSAQICAHEESELPMLRKPPGFAKIFIVNREYAVQLFFFPSGTEQLYRDETHQNDAINH